MVGISKEFDGILGGRLIERNLTHIYGAPASGKTTLALIATANATREGKVIYVDPEGGFSVERIEQIAPNRLNSILENVILIEPTDFDEQKVAIKKLPDVVESSKASLVVVDSIAMLYRLEEDRDIKGLGRQLAQLLRVARQFNIPVLLTNQVYANIEAGGVTPVGGDITKYWSKIMIELEKNENSRTAILRKHKFMPEGARLEFKLVNSGIEVIGAGISTSMANEYEIKEAKNH